MTWGIHWSSGSPFSWRVLLALELKGVPYASHQLQMSKGDLKAPAFLALNPRGKVPVLTYDGFAVSESVACLAYLEAKVPAPPLFGQTAEETGRIWRQVCESLSYLDDPAEAVILPLYFNQTEARRSDIEAAAPKVAAELARLEASLAAPAGGASSDYLTGPKPTAADCVVYPMVRSLERALSKPAAPALGLPFQDLRERYPALARWMTRIEAWPFYERTFPPHWRG